LKEDETGIDMLVERKGRRDWVKEMSRNALLLIRQEVIKSCTRVAAVRTEKMESWNNLKGI